MKPFRVQLNAYVMAEHDVDALRRGAWVSAAARANGMVPGGARVLPVTDSDLENSRALRRLVEKYTEPEHGAPATASERRHLVRVLAAQHGGDLSHAESIVKTLEEGAGYLPQSIARRLLELHPLPVRAAA